VEPQETPAPSVPRPLRDRILGVLAPLLLVIVASTQVVIASTSDLTPWRGGGFGMFSTLDAHDQRILRVTVTTGDTERVPVDPAALLSDGAALRDEAVTARNHPTEGNLERLASAIAEADPGGVGAIEAVEIAVWRTAFDRDTGMLIPELLIDREFRP